MTENKNNINKNRILFLVIILVGAFLRFFKLSLFPAGVHVDEAFAGYEAYSLLKFGVDSWGYHNPIYFISWGSGMNVLESYLMIPFVKLLGLNELSIRLPQAILSVVAMIAFYLILKKVKDEKIALIGLFLMAICPWHYMLSRWGLESNLCLVMILLGTLFFVYGIECFVNKNVSIKKSAYLILSAFFFGLDLYSYAATWIHIAIILVVWTVYAFICYRKSNMENAKNGVANIVIAILLLVIMAIPLFLFILVNIDLIPEIRSIISIPKMVVFRNDEVFSLSELAHRIHDLAYILIAQNDTQMWNGYLPYGMFYIFSLPIIFIGVWRVFLRLFTDFKEKRFSYAFMLVTYTSFATVLVLLQGVSIIRSNYLQLSLLFYWAIGVDYIFTLFKGVLGKVLVLAYLVSFAFFLNSYFTDFQERLGIRQVEGSREAIEKAYEILEENPDKYSAICLAAEIRHARVLFYTGYDQKEYIDNVVWDNYPDKYLTTKSLGPFVWEDYNTNGVDDSRIYIVLYDEKELFERNNYTVIPCGHVWLSYKE